MASLKELIQAGDLHSEHQPWPRITVDTAIWGFAIDQLADARWDLLGLWGDHGTVHMALADATEIAVVSLACPKGQFPSVGARHAPAIRLERAIRDLFGLEPIGATDQRPWLDHGRWDKQPPFRTSITSSQVETNITSSQVETNYAFLPAQGESLHQIPVGPVHAGIIEPGHFRFTANGETVVRLEERLGYVHKGIESLMAGTGIADGAKLAGRTSGDSTVAYAIAFSRAVEAALKVDIPARAHWLRALMAELERLANHLGDIGAICNDAAFALMHAHCGVLRERVLRAANDCFGHRLMRDCVIPGGVSVDLDHSGIQSLEALLENIRQRFPALIELYDNTASLQDRTVGTGHLNPSLARQFCAGGYVGRASGRAHDARIRPGYEPYTSLDFEIPVRNDGDVNARVWVRIAEILQSLSLIEQIMSRLPAGSLSVELPFMAGEGMALVEGFRGDILAWVRLDSDGKIGRCHLRDPSWFQWPLLEAAIEGNIVADFPLCNKSFNCSYSGHDL